MLKDYFSIWDSQIFSSLLIKLKTFDGYNPETIEKFKNTNFYNQVCDRRVNGTSVEKLENVYNKEKLNRYISLTQTFREALKKTIDLLPVSYTVEIFKKLINQIIR